MPFKAKYTFEEFWAELTSGTLYKAYAKANPGEAARLAEIAEKKIRQEPYRMPLDTAKTHTGMAVVMMICTLP